jgi:FkbM family methyltransferase
MTLITAEDVIRRIELYRTSPTRVAASESTDTNNLTHPSRGAIIDAGAKRRRRVLIEFRQGLGAAVQLTSVLRHLNHYHPDWDVHVATPTGRQSAFDGLCCGVQKLDRVKRAQAGFDRVFTFEWEESNTCYANSPSTSAEYYLRTVLRLSPIGDLCTYSIQPNAEARRQAERYLESICPTSANGSGCRPVVLIQSEDETHRPSNGLPEEIVAQICRQALRAGAIPVILDRRNHAAPTDGVRIHHLDPACSLWNGWGTDDAGALAALIEASALMIGVNGGPLYIAGATSTPTIGVWTDRHPLHHYAHAENVVHLVPRNHGSLLRGDQAVGEKYFRRRYRHQLYDDLQSALSEAIAERLSAKRPVPLAKKPSLTKQGRFWVRRDNVKQDLTIVRDVVDQDTYRVDELPDGVEVVVDVGGHIGCFATKAHQRYPRARILTVECCPENLSALRKNVGQFATVIPAALTYEEDVVLLNSVYPQCASTGGSIVAPRKQVQQRVDRGKVPVDFQNRGGVKYWADLRRLDTLSLEQLIEQYDLPRIDVLKLDCEGSEFSILEHATVMDRVSRIIGEYHGKERFLKLVNDRYVDWDLRILQDGRDGIFWLTAPELDARSGVEIPKEPEEDNNKRMRHESPRTPSAPIGGTQKKTVLLKFSHGLGDAVQLTAVLKHLRHCRPEWDVEVAALLGKHSALRGQCRRVHILNEYESNEAGYDHVYDLGWHECSTCFSNWPSTKVERCLTEVFRLNPDLDLCSYSIAIGDEARNRARRYLDRTCAGSCRSDGRYPAVLIHYEGNTSSQYKNLSVEIVRDFCEKAIRLGYVPVILDWDDRSPLPDGKRIHNPSTRSSLWGGLGTGDAEILAALIESASMMIGVDSGPLHVAATTTTPTVGVWTGHHPLHYMSPTDNMTHLVPAGHEEMLRGDPKKGLRFFESHYRYQVYDALGVLPDMLASQLPDVNEETPTAVFPTQTQIRRRVERHADSDEEAPIFVSGIPRSGTTWMQWFLSRHPAIHIHGQLPNLDWQAGWQWYQHLIECGERAAQSNERIDCSLPHYAGSDEERCRRLFREMVRGYLTGFAKSTRRWGVKSLMWCLEAGVVEQVESLWPETRWVVCIRDPFLSIASEKNTFRPDADVNMAARSWVRMCEFTDRHDPERTAVFQIDRVDDEQDRLQATTEVLRIVGAGHTDETHAALREFPVVHKVKPDEQREFAFTDAEKVRLLREVGGLADWMERFAYPAPDD